MKYKAVYEALEDVSSILYYAMMGLTVAAIFMALFGAFVLCITTIFIVVILLLTDVRVDHCRYELVKIIEEDEERE